GGFADGFGGGGVVEAEVPEAVDGEDAGLGKEGALAEFGEFSDRLEDLAGGVGFRPFEDLEDGEAVEACDGGEGVGGFEGGGEDVVGRERLGWRWGGGEVSR